jgi:zinc transport system substrate-binding protein
MYTGILFSGSPLITVSIPPQAYFIHQIAGEERFDINIMIPNGQSPAVYSPKPSQMKKMNRSDGFFLIGHPAFIFEDKHIRPYLNKNEFLPVFNLYEKAHRYHYSVDPHDPHLWMSPVLIQKIVQDMANYLAGFYPDDSLHFQKEAGRFTKEITALQEEIRVAFKKHNVEQFIIFHPSWGYFSRDFNIEQIAIEKHGHEPGPRYLSEITQHTHTHDTDKIIIQKGFSRKSAEAVANETGATVVEADPLAYDWVESLKTMKQLLTE